MVWSKIAPADGKPRYIRKYGAFVLLTKEKHGALDEIPPGWDVVTLPSGYLKIRRTK